ncbi:MAG: hypothetical protein PQ612_05740 [Rickettsiales bacterium]|nr:hypothetical protein [Pseudomonadota bacterium]MDA0966522.1 hypothetical protein [Pseudomonadota bacterium]MDG4543384.1 hypothetical protein [Rickettsiales bacterium]MDG4545650.1 hypothetical protein [Rickettsiales bacterium]MDG4548099.1 hypothetical protein [Rickettsiales bacterium]
MTANYPLKRVKKISPEEFKKYNAESETEGLSKNDSSDSITSVSSWVDKLNISENKSNGFEERLKNNPSQVGLAI